MQSEPSGGRGEGQHLRGYTADDCNLKVAVVGGGPVGMALALVLHKQGIKTEIFDVRTRGAGLADRRILALSHGSRQTLEWLGIWHEIMATPISTIHVSQQGHLGRTQIHAAQQGVPALGQVLSLHELIAALDRAITAAAIPYHDNTLVDEVIGHPDAAHFSADRSPRQAQLLAYAEGVVDEAAAGGNRDYGQHAVTCVASLEKSHQGVAWERFTPAGPIALLPFGREVAVVLTCPASEAARVAGLSEAAFLSYLQMRFGQRVSFVAAGPRFSFPLGLRYRRQPVAERQVWLGNAAQTLHPVAGQGFNLALRDVRTLAHVLAGTKDSGTRDVLAQYARKRRADRYATIGFTDTLVRLFSNDNSLLSHARGAGLMALDIFPAARGFVARRMMFGARAWP